MWWAVRHVVKPTDHSVKSVFTSRGNLPVTPWHPSLSRGHSTDSHRLQQSRQPLITTFSKYLNYTGKSVFNKRWSDKSLLPSMNVSFIADHSYGYQNCTLLGSRSFSSEICYTFCFNKDITGIGVLISQNQARRVNFHLNQFVLDLRTVGDQCTSISSCTILDLTRAQTKSYFAPLVLHQINKCGN